VKRARKGAVVKPDRQTKSLFASQDRKPRLLFKMVNLVLRQELSLLRLERKLLEEDGELIADGRSCSEDVTVTLTRHVPDKDVWLCLDLWQYVVMSSQRQAPKEALDPKVGNDDPDCNPGLAPSCALQIVATAFVSSLSLQQPYVSYVCRITFHTLLRSHR
jgi:hypothetical protein